MDDDELHIQLRTDTGRYRYIRRVPADVARLDGREFVRESLGTADRSVAIERAKARDTELEEFWQSLFAGAESRDAWQRQRAAGRLAEAMGFDPLSAEQILAGDVDELVARLLTLAGREDDALVVDALLGPAETPQLQLSGLFSLYMSLKDAELVGYSPSQLRRHKQAKERAALYLLTVLGDKSFPEVTRLDALRFRSWWETKIAAEGLSRDSANRSFADIQGMFAVIDEAMLTNYRAVWGGLRIKEARRRQKRRPSFEPAFVQKRILAPGALDSIRFDVRMAFYAQIETGARPSEICNLTPEANQARARPIPHIIIEETDERILKSGNATRIIPLVGVSLWALRQCPDGFPALRNNEDAYSATIGKAFTRLGLRPTPKHTPYSIRHTFQDRILAAGAGDRLQTDLMGHEFERVKYGEGPSLKQKLQLLEKIKFYWAEP